MIRDGGFPTQSHTPYNNRAQRYETRRRTGTSRNPNKAPGAPVIPAVCQEPRDPWITLLDLAAARERAVRAQLCALHLALHNPSPK